MRTLVACLVTLAIFQISQIQGQRQIGCRNEQGELVDWFIGYKLPRQDWQQDEQRKKGFAFLYMDQSTSGQWKRSQFSIDDERQSAGYTLSQFYSNLNNASVFRMLYNDEFPNGTWTLTYGHTKGSLVFDSTSGFWLIHSVPKYPFSTESYAYPPTGAKYGQSFFCITFSYSMLQEIANQLLYNEPYIYHWALPEAMARDNQYLVKLGRGDTFREAPFFRKTILTSQGGVRLTSFSKNLVWDQELYTDLVAPTVQRVLFAETWQNGPSSENIGSNCTAPYRVYNIANVSLSDDIAFSVHDDHSKWVVSNETVSNEAIPNQDGYWICIGDINRQKEQFKRSGGTVCMQNEAVWRTFRQSVKKYEECPIDTNVWNFQKKSDV